MVSQLAETERQEKEMDLHREFKCSRFSSGDEPGLGNYQQQLVC